MPKFRATRSTPVETADHDPELDHTMDMLCLAVGGDQAYESNGVKNQSRCISFSEHAAPEIRGVDRG